MKFIMETGATEKRSRIIAGILTSEVVPVKYTLDLVGDMDKAKRVANGCRVYPQGENANGH